MKYLSILLLSVISFGSMAQSQYTKVAGDWTGSISTPSGTSNIIFHIKYDGENLSGTMDRPDQNAFGLKIDEVSFVDGVLKMKSNVVQGSYEGTLYNNKLEGKWTQGGKSIDLNLKKKQKTGSS